MTLFNWIVTLGIVSSCVFSEICTWTQKVEKVMVNCSERGLRYIPKLNDSVTYLDYLLKATKPFNFNWSMPFPPK